MVTNELTSREKQAAAMAERLHANHKMLEERLEILNKQHQSTVAQFAGRQNEAKSMIREALQYLQEALNRLDLGSADMSISEVQLDRGVMDEFNSILRESEQAFAELNSRIRETGNVIHKIENLNNQLTDTTRSWTATSPRSTPASRGCPALRAGPGRIGRRQHRRAGRAPRSRRTRGPDRSAGDRLRTGRAGCHKRRRRFRRCCR